MLKKTVKFTDYDGVEREEDLYFNFSKAEIIKLQIETPGGLAGMLERMVKAQNAPDMMKMFETILLKAYGEKSPDGKYFRKSDQISNDFKSTEAYSELFMELLTDDEKAAEFINKVIPADVAEEVAKHSPEELLEITKTTSDN